MQGKGLPGFRDFYPEDLALRNHIFATWRSVARRYGFEEYDGPPLEPLELYTQKSGEEIVQQLYSFRDKGDREVALRPEMTPTLARMVRARPGAEETDPLVRDPPAVPLRAATAGAVTGALPVEHGHRRGSRSCGRRRSHGGGARHHAGVRLRARGRTPQGVGSPGRGGEADAQLRGRRGRNAGRAGCARQVGADAGRDGATPAGRPASRPRPDRPGAPVHLRSAPGRR